MVRAKISNEQRAVLSLWLDKEKENEKDSRCWFGERGASIKFSRESTATEMSGLKSTANLDYLGESY